MKAFCSFDQQQQHDPQTFISNGHFQPCQEVPQRLNVLIDAATSGGLHVVEPADHGLAPIAAVHTPEYLQFLSSIHQRWQQIEGSSDEVIPGIQPNRQDFSYPESPVGQAGYHMADTACPIGSGTWAAVQASANCAASAASEVLDGASAAYALCRPPGHHAYADMAGGFCYVNNAAVAAQMLRAAHDRVVIIDVDLHHGNGTQGIFYGRSDVLTISIHANPISFYPFFWGHASERGEGAGLGYNYNLPLRRGSGDNAFLAALESALTRLHSFAPTALVVSLGLDAFEGDPFAGLTVTTPGFAEIGKLLGSTNLPTVIVQEGGYLCEELGNNLKSFIYGFTHP